MTKRTKPRQAASPATVDRLERELRLILPRVAYLHSELSRLLRMVQGSERR